MNEAIKIRRLSIDEFIKEGWRIYKKYFRDIILIVICIVLPAEIMRETTGLVMNQIAVSYAFTNAAATDIHNIDFLPFCLQSGILILYNIILLMPILSIAFLVEDEIEGREISWRTSLQRGFARLPSAVGTLILAGIIVFLLSLLFIIPGIIWYGYYLFAIYVVSLRETGGKDALDYSKRLVTGQWWMVVIIMAVLDFLKGVAYQLVSIPYEILGDIPFLTSIGNTGVEIVVALLTVVAVVYFLNPDYLRGPERKESPKPSISTSELPPFQLPDRSG